jgi:hypothetical protein
MKAYSSTRPARSAAPAVARASAAVFADLAKKTKYVEPSLAERWPALAGEKLARLCRPGRLTGRGQGKTLELRVPSGAAAAAVQMEADGLIARLNAYLGPGAVGRISVIQTGPAVSARAPEAEPAENPPGDGELGAALASFRAAIRRRNGGK